ncbi:MAG: glycoside hydrolase family 3 C-terminal domain-containing protein, partial [Spirochaetes bacterium]|nr:glycoside hydrolase family 3 C-terminal domain-containing protein [Spirochaetota bacterium]
PCVAVPQDERWGRTYEGFSEDSALVSRLGAAAVLGLQGSADLLQLADTGFILATAKHFVGDGGTAKGKDQGDAVIDEETLRAMHLPPYEAAIKAGVRSVMISFSSWNGVKLHQHKYLITDVLKIELDFSGFVVSDWAGVKQLPGSPKEQIRLAINAGIDMVMVPDSWREFISDLRSLVQSGEVEMARIDDAVYRILLTKFELGLFERPLADRELLALVGSAEHRQLAREAVQASLVVLKNNNILPLSAGLRRIGVVGAAADDIGAQCGGWTITWQGANGAITEGTTILEGIQSLAGPQLQLVYAKTAAELGPVDLAIVVAAEKPYAEGQGDDPVLAFPSGMAAEVKRLKAAGIPVLTILLSGRPLLAGDVVADSDAFIAAWLPGTEGGGIADLLFGKVSPSGTLPFTWFSDIASIPLNAKKAGPGVLFPAGYGLSW